MEWWSEGVAPTFQHSNAPILQQFTAPAKEHGRRAGYAKCQTKGRGPMRPKARQDGNEALEPDPSTCEGKLVLPPNRPAECKRQATHSDERQLQYVREVTGVLLATNRTQGKAIR